MPRPGPRRPLLETATGLTDTPEYDVLYVRGSADSDGNWVCIEATICIRDDPTAAEKLAARFPKSVKARPTKMFRGDGTTDGFVTFRADIASDGARRFRTLMAAAASLGVRVEYVPVGPYRMTAEQIAEATNA